MAERDFVDGDGTLGRYSWAGGAGTSQAPVAGVDLFLARRARRPNLRVNMALRAAGTASLAALLLLMASCAGLAAAQPYVYDEVRAHAGGSGRRLSVCSALSRWRERGGARLAFPVVSWARVDRSELAGRQLATSRRSDGGGRFGV